MPRLKKEVNTEMAELTESNNLTIENLPLSEQEAVVDKLNQNIKVRIINESNSYKPPVRDEKIVLRPANEKLLRSGTTTVLRPVMSKETKKLITGQPYFTEEEKKNVIKVVDEFTERRFVGVVVLDLNNPIDAIDWEWLKHHPYIAKSKEEAETNPTYRYYIDSKDKSAESYVMRKKYEVALIDKIMNLSLIKKRRLARILDLSSEDIGEVELDKLLLELAQDDYSKPIAKRMSTLLEDESKFNFIYLSKVLIDKGDITFEFGNYKYKNTLIGTSYEEYLQWLNRPEQSGFVAIKQSQYL